MSKTGTSASATSNSCAAVVFIRFGPARTFLPQIVSEYPFAHLAAWPSARPSRMRNARDQEDRVGERARMHTLHETRRHTQSYPRPAQHRPPGAWYAADRPGQHTNILPRRT